MEQPAGPTEIANISRICQCQSEVPEGVLKNQRDSSSCQSSRTSSEVSGGRCNDVDFVNTCLGGSRAA